MADTRQPGFTWGTVEHLFSIHLGLVAGVATTATFGAWAGTGLIVLIVAFALWVTWRVTPPEGSDRDGSQSADTLVADPSGSQEPRAEDAE